MEPPHDDAPPRPSALIESLRAFGYTLQTALADLIDNSVAAGATNVWLDAEWDGAKSRITLLDDGRGMSEEELLEAMRPGSQSPLEDRELTDLGRFGLGLKTASFSQCRCLTVASRPAKGPVAVRRWDLDFVRDTNQWWVLKTPTENSADQLKRLEKMRQGTLVIWEQLDRAIGLEGTELPDGAALEELRKHFLHAISKDVKPHLAMVFHRFLEGDARRMTIHVNGTRLDGWDPFRKHAARQALPEEPIQARGGVVIRPKAYVMPHKDRLTAAEHTQLAGPAGWNAQQGFYVYRKKRLLVAGSWLGLGFTKDEHMKLARIQLDIPESGDPDWSIDVKKSSANPPPAVRSALTRLAKLAREKADDVYRHRAGKGPGSKAREELVRIWTEVKRKNGKRSYRIKRDHPLVARALATPKEFAPAIEALLCVIEETLPVDRIFHEESKEPDASPVPFEGVPDREIVRVIEQVYQGLRDQGYPPAAARQRLLEFEYLCQYGKIIAELKD